MVHLTFQELEIVTRRLILNVAFIQDEVHVRMSPEADISLFKQSAVKRNEFDMMLSGYPRLNSRLAAISDEIFFAEHSVLLEIFQAVEEVLRWEDEVFETSIAA